MWLSLDDNFDSDPRVKRAGWEAAWLHTRAMIYCARHLTDGVYPCEVLLEIPRGRSLARRLVKVGLWETKDGDFFLPDFLQWNSPREEVERRREEAKRIRSAGGKARAESAVRSAGKFVRHQQGNQQDDQQAAGVSGGYAKPVHSLSLELQEKDKGFMPSAKTTDEEKAIVRSVLDGKQEVFRSVGAVSPAEVARELRLVDGPSRHLAGVGRK